MDINGHQEIAPRRSPYLPGPESVDPPHSVAQQGVFGREPSLLPWTGAQQLNCWPSAILVAANGQTEIPSWSAVASMPNSPNLKSEILFDTSSLSPGHMASRSHLGPGHLPNQQHIGAMAPDLVQDPGTTTTAATVQNSAVTATAARVAAGAEAYRSVRHEKPKLTSSQEVSIATMKDPMPVSPMVMARQPSTVAVLDCSGRSDHLTLKLPAQTASPAASNASCGAVSVPETSSVKSPSIARTPQTDVNGSCDFQGVPHRSENPSQLSTASSLLPSQLDEVEVAVASSLPMRQLEGVEDDPSLEMSMQELMRLHTSFEDLHQSSSEEKDMLECQIEAASSTAMRFDKELADHRSAPQEAAMLHHARRECAYNKRGTVCKVLYREMDKDVVQCARSTLGRQQETFESEVRSLRLAAEQAQIAFGEERRMLEEQIMSTSNAAVKAQSEMAKYHLVLEDMEWRMGQERASQTETQTLRDGLAAEEDRAACTVHANVLAPQAQAITEDVAAYHLALQHLQRRHIEREAAFQAEFFQLRAEIAEAEAVQSVEVLHTAEMRLVEAGARMSAQSASHEDETLELMRHLELVQGQDNASELFNSQTCGAVPMSDSKHSTLGCWQQ
eukprot:gnl/TRDRNA2_/TRDRNA2_167519_c0_seq1.p1 gnl/TRDRNA2_/TRDRNA2_167519_c0~~gnl/TRDRNA2_/TRDRNA2_167519_c0_seq1.p1  ORF type:complete len:617 (+),score=112.74 gnl/TRDRNA2_/TRDRNA2_167519_c0_seq1:102-1952(+)